MKTQSIVAKVLKIHSDDNVLVALAPLKAGERIEDRGVTLTLVSDVAPKHKIATRHLATGDPIVMYGILVGKALKPIAAGEPITTLNTRHNATAVKARTASSWAAPEVGRWREKRWSGYRRGDGQGGTKKY